MIALDANLLVYADQRRLPQHRAARAVLDRLAAADEPCGLPVFAVGEYLRVVTHPRLFDPPTPLAEALANIGALLASDAFSLLLPGERYWSIFARLAGEGDARGNLVFDAQIAALCLEHRVGELWTADRDLARFPGLRTRNPLA